VKGGHLQGDELVDVLHDGSGCASSATALDTRSTHGTGCTLSAAVAAGSPRAPLHTAVVDRARLRAPRYCRARRIWAGGTGR
jgi:hydroxymethylpyrimidine/phosphomethylpyrimidine kinase